MTPLIFALSLMTAASPAVDQGGGEPLPPGAPTDPYELSAWCYGALGEYLAIYEEVKPDLRDIDRMFGTSVKEAEPYQSDMAAYRVELKLIGDSVTAAEKASPQPISDRGVMAMRKGREIWSIAETKTSRELARAWLTWDLPDRCDSNARELTAKSVLLGKALSYNNGPGVVDQAATEISAAPALAPAPPQAAAESAPPAAEDAAPTASEPPAPAAIAGPSAVETPPPAEAAAQTPPQSGASDAGASASFASPPPPAIAETAPPAAAESAGTEEPPPASGETQAPPPAAPPPAPASDQSQEPTL